MAAISVLSYDKFPFVITLDREPTG